MKSSNPPLTQWLCRFIFWFGAILPLAAAPSISSISPSPVPPLSSNQTLTIRGSGFVNGATLTFDPPTGGNINSTASKLHFETTARITYDFNNGSDTGEWRVRVNNPDGQVSSWKSFDVEYPEPSIDSISPASLPASNSNVTLTINGEDFRNGATLTFNPPTGSNINSTASKLHFDSAARIRYDFNSGNDAGEWEVRVNNPDGQSSSWESFMVTAVVSDPDISSVSPSSMVASNRTQTLTINGSDFRSGATLTFDPPTGSNIGSTASKLHFESSAQIRYDFNNGNDAGEWRVRVTNPDGETSGWESFTVTPVFAAPTVSSVSPTSLPASSANQTMTINGSGFQSGATLTFDPPTGSNIDSTASRLTFDSSSQIRYDFNNANDAGTWRLRVNNPDGQSSNWLSYEVTNPVPAISSVSPASLPATSTNQTLTIDGENFVQGVTVVFDPPSGPNIAGNPAKLSFQSVTRLQYDFNAAGDVGAWAVRVTNPNGSESNWKSFDAYAVESPPSISSLSPTSIAASNSNISLTVTGGNFQAGVSLIFDPPTGPNLQSNPAKLTRVSGSQIDYLFNSAGDAGSWRVKARNPDGLESEWKSFNVTPATTNPSMVSQVTIVGPVSLPHRAQQPYLATARFSDGSSRDVTDSASWAVEGNSPVGSTISGGYLQLGDAIGRRDFKIKATYNGLSNSKTGELAVTAGAEFTAKLTFTKQRQPNGSWNVLLSATSSGGIAPVTYFWDLYGDGTFDRTGANPSPWNLPDIGKDYTVTLRATDSVGNTAPDSRTVTIEKALQPNQPERLDPSNDIKEGRFLDKNGNPFQFITTRIPNGLIVITHGLNDGGSTGWCAEMASKIEERLTAEGKPLPNILIYDWENASNPNKVDFDEVVRAGSKLRQIGLTMTLRGLAAIGVAEFITDCLGIRDIGKSYGLILASELREEVNAAVPRVDGSAPIHFIGHSAGGFVTGEAALVLKRAGITVDRVTLLDTPAPYESHLIDLPGPGVVERIISSAYGTLEWPGNGDIQPGGNYTYKLLEAYWRLTFGAHQDAYRWYTSSTIAGNESSGFYFSPFLHGPLADRTQSLASPRRPRSPADFITGFSSFGQVSSSGALHTLTEQADSGIFKEIAVPANVERLKFKYRFAGAGDGDFLGVRFGTRPEMFFGLDLPLSREQFVECEVELGSLAGLTDKLVFTLVSRNDPNSVVEIKDIEMTLSDDPDGDGLTEQQEAALGTSSQLQDSDGDGLGDADELLTLGTNPAASDSDGDGMSDSDETSAGTNPLNPASRFVVDDIHEEAGGMRISWNGASGVVYRILRSQTPGFGEHDVIANGVAGQSGRMSHLDDSIDMDQESRMFYRVETVPSD